ncbi:MAG: LPS export ABC transporter periplasmic protein LptC [Duncaniella sp.]|nr:LPS export ABC transporter periplasmic protein LptC [Duncaniella sp.]MDE7145767.1 LPS export ABC transporter periplasmic protein LptC [Duncaniella sp.]
MSNPVKSDMRLLPFVAAAMIAVTGMMTSGCKEDNPVSTSDIDASLAPTMLTRNVETLISDSGVTRFRIVTPIWYVYDEAEEPYWRFPEGLKLDKYDLFFRKEASVEADSAIYFKNKQIWRLDGHVNITNVMNEKFLTNQLFWDQRQHKLYSDSFIHIERPDKVLEGYGFDSNEQLTRYSIRNVSGIFPANSFQPGSGGSRQATPEPASASASEPASASASASANAATATVTDTATDTATQEELKTEKAK